jgi:hypothetical protein
MAPSPVCKHILSLYNNRHIHLCSRSREGKYFCSTVLGHLWKCLDSDFPDCTRSVDRMEDELAWLGELAKTPEGNIIKLPNISASVPQVWNLQTWCCYITWILQWLHHKIDFSLTSFLFISKKYYNFYLFNLLSLEKL